MELNHQPILSGELVLLRSLKFEDFEELYSVASDPLLWQQIPQSNRYQREVFASLFKGWMEIPGSLLASDKKTNKVIGASRYYEYDESKSTVAIGYTFLARQCWGHNFNKDMKKLMLDHAFTSVQNVIFHAAEINIRSQKALKKIGAKLIEKKEKQFNGISVPYLTFQIKKSEYVSSQQTTEVEKKT